MQVQENKQEAVGLSAVFSAFQQIDKFWMPDDYHHGKIALRDLMLNHVHPRWKSEHLETKHAVPGDKIYTHKSSNFEITALSPLEKDVWKVNFDIYRAKSKGTRAGSANRLSIVLHIKYNQTYALLGSDAEKVTWQVIADSPYLPMEGEQKIDIFKVPHHGSIDAWDKGKLSPLLNQNQFTAIVSAAGDKRTSPAKEVLCDLTELGGSIYCTGRSVHCSPRNFVDRDCCGHIVVKVDENNEIMISMQKEGRETGVGYCSDTYRKSSGASC